MTLEEAIQTAIAYETKIRDVYRKAAREISDSVGRRILQALGDDEQRHVEYLLNRLKIWREKGILSLKDLETTIPSKEIIAREGSRLKRKLCKEDRGDEKQLLSQALKLEIETSGFYKKMVDEMSDDAQRMFGRFLDIEAGHIAAVQAELDYLSRTGYWLDFKEFDME
jgi:rubrerythrin